MEKNIARQAILRGEEIPSEIANAPTLDECDEFYHIAFWELNTERQLGMGGVGPIPRSKIVQYANDYNFSYKDREDLVYVIRHVDTEYVNHKNKS